VNPACAVGTDHVIRSRATTADILRFDELCAAEEAVTKMKPWRGLVRAVAPKSCHSSYPDDRRASPSCRRIRSG
jgi:hypothetical protein